MQVVAGAAVIRGNYPAVRATFYAGNGGGVIS
jgi:hypothetical protein